MFDLSGTGGGDHRDDDIVTDVIDELDVKAGIGAVLVNAIQKKHPGTKLFTGLGPL